MDRLSSSIQPGKQLGCHLLWTFRRDPSDVSVAVGGLNGYAARSYDGANWMAVHRPNVGHGTQEEATPETEFLEAVWRLFRRSTHAAANIALTWFHEGHTYVGTCGGPTFRRSSRVPTSSTRSTASGPWRGRQWAAASARANAIRGCAAPPCSGSCRWSQRCSCGWAPYSV